MPRFADLLAASGWRRTFDGTALPDGAVAFVRDRCPAAAGALLVLGGARSAWVPALFAEGLPTAVLDPSRRDLARLEAAFPPGSGGPAAPRFVHGDPRDFETVPGAVSVLVPCPLLASLGTAEERRDVLRGALSQRGPGGAVLVHHEPVPDDLLAAAGAEARVIGIVPFPDPAGGPGWTRTTTVEREPPSGRLLLRHRLAREDGGAGDDRGLLLATLAGEALLADLEAAGLAARETLGGYDGAPYAPGRPLIVVARPRRE